MRNPIDRISEAEFAVMKILWDSSQPVTTGAIYKELSEKRSWDRSTVRTLLRRLAEKGAAEEIRKPVLCYRPAVSEKAYRDSQTRNFLDRLYAGSAKKLVATLVQNNEFTSEDIEELRQFLNEGEDGNV